MIFDISPDVFYNKFKDYVLQQDNQTMLLYNITGSSYVEFWFFHQGFTFHVGLGLNDAYIIYQTEDVKEAWDKLLDEFINKNPFAIKVK